MFYNLLNKSTENGTVAPGVADEMMGIACTEVTMIFWAVIAIVGVVGAIAYTTSITSMKASGIRLMIASVVASAVFYILPGIVAEIKIVCGW